MANQLIDHVYALHHTLDDGYIKIIKGNINEPVKLFNDSTIRPVSSPQLNSANSTLKCNIDDIPVFSLSDTEN